jgi:hypothetical protein
MDVDKKQAPQVQKQGQTQKQTQTQAQTQPKQDQAQPPAPVQTQLHAQPPAQTMEGVVPAAAGAFPESQIYAGVAVQTPVQHGYGQPQWGAGSIGWGGGMAMGLGGWGNTQQPMQQQMPVGQVHLQPPPGSLPQQNGLGMHLPQMQPSQYGGYTTLSAHDYNAVSFVGFLFLIRSALSVKATCYQVSMGQLTQMSAQMSLNQLGPVSRASSK